MLPSGARCGCPQCVGGGRETQGVYAPRWPEAELGFAPPAGPTQPLDHTGGIGWAAPSQQHWVAGVSEKDSEVSWCPGHSEMTKAWAFPVSKGNPSGPSGSRVSLFQWGVLRTRPAYGALIGTTSWKGLNADDILVSTERDGGPG